MAVTPQLTGFTRYWLVGFFLIFGIRIANAAVGTFHHDIKIAGDVMPEITGSKLDGRHDLSRCDFSHGSSKPDHWSSKLVAELVGIDKEDWQQEYRDDQKRNYVVPVARQKSAPGAFESSSQTLSDQADEAGAGDKDSPMGENSFYQRELDSAIGYVT